MSQSENRQMKACNKRREGKGVGRTRGRVQGRWQVTRLWWMQKGAERSLGRGHTVTLMGALSPLKSRLPVSRA